jgi:hypothetical protein
MTACSAPRRGASRVGQRACRYAGVWLGVGAQVMKHHPNKGYGKSGREQHSIYYPEDNVTEVIDLHKEEWRHIVKSIKTSYRGTVIKSSIEDGLQVHLDGGAVRDATALLKARATRPPKRRGEAEHVWMLCAVLAGRDG